VTTGTGEQARLAGAEPKVLAIGARRMGGLFASPDGGFAAEAATERQGVGTPCFATTERCLNPTFAKPIPFPPQSGATPGKGPRRF
jgi:hypothetical protein